MKPPVNWKAIVRRGVVWLIGAVAAAIVGYFAVEAVQKWIADRKVPQLMLQEAAQDRARFTDSSLSAAASIYRSLLSRSPAPQDSSHALVGLARTYADLAMLRFWRGLSSAAYPRQARTYALHAMRIGRDPKEVSIALAYAYASDEIDRSPKSATRAKVEELLEEQTDNLDTRYLAWVADFDEASQAFPFRVQAESLNDLRILLDVSSYLLGIAEQVPSALKGDTLSRAEEFLSRAASIQPHNPFLLFRQAYLSGVQRNAEEGKALYLEALQQEPQFPRAYSNLGVLYAQQGDFQQARRNFEAAAMTPDAPVEGQRIWFQNLGSADFELSDTAAACESWQRAAELAGSSDDWLSAYGMALCHYAQGHHELAVDDFRRAAKIAARDGVDLSKPSTFRELRSGPRELGADSALIQLAR